jgi:hypothetical protein
MKKNTINKIKLMMSYEMGKTLTENKVISNVIEESDVEIDEQGVAVKDLVAAGKVGRDFKMGLDDLAKFAIKDNNAILVKDAKGLPIPAQTGDEIINAIKKGAIAPEELAKVNFGLFKSIGTSENTLKLLATDIVESPKFMKEYKKYWDPNNRVKLKEILKGRGYSESGSEALISKIENNNYWKEIDAGKVRLGKAKEEIKTLSVQNANKFGSGADAAAATREELTAVKDANTKAVAEESAKVTEKMKPTTWEKWKKWSKEHPNSTKLIYFLGLAAGAWASYKLFFGNTDPKEVKDKTFTNCAGDLLEVNGTKILTTKSGDPVISVPTTGNQDYDSHKGLMFYPNNRVFLGDQSKRGTWGCKGNTIGVQSEQTTGLPGVDLGLGTLSKIAQNREINRAESVGNVLNKINITWDTKSNGGGGGKTDGGGGKTDGGNQSTIPTELKDTDGVKKFQSWLDSKHAGWHSKYGILNDNTLRGWGKYGPNTSKAWGQYKDEYLNGLTGTETPNTTGSTPNTTGSTTTDTTTDNTNQTDTGLASMIKTSDNKPQEVTPEIQQLIDRGKEIYTRLYDNYNAEGQPKPLIKKDGNRLKYKGKKLGNDELNALNQYIKSLGYSYMKQKDKKYIPLEDDVKYVWEKNTESEVQQPETGEQEPETQAQEPTQLSEDFIKKIVSKHLRSKL